MSGDELVVTVVSLVCAGGVWAFWYLGPSRVRRFGRQGPGRRLVQLAPLAAAAILILVLQTAAAHDVRDDPRYLTLYFALGAAWVGLSALWLPVAGISARDDVFERANTSAGYAVAGAILAITSCYAGGNIGDGPGWWVVVFSAGLATLALFVAWLLLEALTGVSDVVTIDRDRSAGVRLAGFLVACGLVFGRAVAGDWVSAGATVRDFVATAWPAAILVIMAAIVERAARPTPERPAQPVLTFGLVPALLYVAGAIRQILTLGLPA